MLLLALSLCVQSLCLNQIWAGVEDIKLWWLTLRNNICTHWTQAQCGVSWCWGIHYWLCLYYLWHHTSTKGHLSTTAIFFGGQSTHSLLFQPLYNGHFFSVPKVAVVERFNCINQIIGDCKCPQHQKTTTQFSGEHLWDTNWCDSSASVLLAHCTIECLYGKVFITIQCHTGC